MLQPNTVQINNNKLGFRIPSKIKRLTVVWPFSSAQKHEITALMILPEIKAIGAFVTTKCSGKRISCTAKNYANKGYF